MLTTIQQNYVILESKYMFLKFQPAKFIFRSEDSQVRVCGTNDDFQYNDDIHLIIEDDMHKKPEDDSQKNDDIKCYRLKQGSKAWIITGWMPLKIQ